MYKFNNLHGLSIFASHPSSFVATVNLFTIMNLMKRINSIISDKYCPIKQKTDKTKRNLEKERPGFPFWRSTVCQFLGRFQVGHLDQYQYHTFFLCMTINSSLKLHLCTLYMLKVLHHKMELLQPLPKLPGSFLVCCDIGEAIEDVLKPSFIDYQFLKNSNLCFLNF